MIGRVFKDCVDKNRCASERCKHGYWLDFTPPGAGPNRRQKMSILKAFGVVCLSRTEAQTKYLPEFVKEVTKAHREGHQPFASKRLSEGLAEDVVPLADEVVRALRNLVEAVARHNTELLPQSCQPANLDTDQTREQ